MSMVLPNLNLSRPWKNALKNWGTITQISKMASGKKSLDPRQYIYPCHGLKTLKAHFIFAEGMNF